MEEFSLNKEQKKAVRHKIGPLLIVAGAGTGKTRVITERIRWLIENKKAKADEILALTFTEKAAQEMLERVDTLMPLGYEEPWLSTFHAFADRILNQEALEIGLDPSYKIVTDPQKWLLIRNNLFNFDLNYYRPLGNPTKFINAMLLLFSRLQDEDIGVDKFNKWAKDEKWIELANAYKKYEEIKIKGNKLDFGDLISWTLRLFRERKNVLSKYQEQFKYVLVDEFQDTNYAQFELIKLLCPAGKNPNLMVVCDDDQSIYRFRGASVSNVLEFKETYPKSQTVVLTKNYRSKQDILDASYRLIQNNNPDRLEVKIGIDKKLKGESKGAGIIEALSSPTVEEEAENTVKKIIEILGKEGDYTYRDFAILARANNHLDPFVATLKRYGLSYQLVGNRGLFDQEEVKVLVSFLRVVANPEDNLSLFHLLLTPTLGAKSGDVIGALNSARLEKRSLWDVIGKKEEFIDVVNLIKKVQKEILEEKVSNILYKFVLDSNYIKPLLEKESIENNLRLKNINLFFDRVKMYESDAPNLGVIEFVEYLDNLIEAGENPAQAVIEDIDTINLLTVHAAKGLEFPVVFLVNLVSDRFPTRNRRDPIPIPDDLVKETLPEGNYHLEEERRLFYVGVTRAKKYLYLTYAKNYGGVKEKRVSGFVEELGVEVPDIGGSNQLNLLSPPRQQRIPARSCHSVAGGRTSVLGGELPKFLSYSQISYFKTCPLKYKYKYVLGVPTPPHHSLSFGQTMHNTLRDFHRADLFGEKRSEEELLTLYEKNWIPFGYESLNHRRERFNQGKEILRNYFKRFKDIFGKPIFLEKKFRLNVGPKPLIGVIDRVDKTSEGYEIIDYKTGMSKDQKVVDKDNQLTIYALGASEALGVTPSKLSLYFIEDDKKISTKRSKQQMEEKKKEILKVMGEIEKSNFKAKSGFWCNYCEFKKICPWAFKG